ncbi:MAG: TIGR00341 family protein [Thermodesulfobacteria bacterium]|nr:TIGR00341 family protein [Thermodesulfobacteriota bacterium]
MFFKLIEVIIPKGRASDISQLLQDFELKEIWISNFTEDELAKVSILVSEDKVEQILDILDSYLKGLPKAKALLLPVEITIPREGKEKKQEEKDTETTGRISRQELRAFVTAGCTITKNYLLMVFFSGVVAAIGLVRNDVAIIIGAMVLAPLLLPNMALGLASTLGDIELVWRSLKSVGVGILLAFFTGLIFALFTAPDPTIPSIKARTSASFGDVVLALASGSAGALAIMSRGHLSLIGVMVAVALMPPLVTAGLMFGAGNFILALGALELFLANIIAINLAAVLTFRLHGLKPATWWESERANKATRIAILIWGSLLVLLLALLVIVDAR